MSLGTKPASTAALDAPTEVHHPTPYRTLNITFQQSVLQCCFIELRRFYGISSLHPPLCILCHQCKVYCHKIIQDTVTWLLQNHMLHSKMETCHMVLTIRRGKGMVRDVPAAPSLSASFSSITKLSLLLRPRPPDITTRALPNSGRSDSCCCCPTQSERLTISRKMSTIQRHTQIKKDIMYK